MYFELRETGIGPHVQTSEAQALLALWRAARDGAGGALPDLDRLKAGGLSSHMPYLMVLARDGTDWRYPVFGSGLVEQYGVDWTGRTARDYDIERTTFVDRCCSGVLARGEPAYAMHSAVGAPGVLLWERLMLPCRDGSGAAVVLTYLHPVEYVVEMLRAVLDLTPSAILRVRCLRDEAGEVVDGVVLMANELAAGLLGRPADWLKEGCLLELFPTFVDLGVWARCLDVVRLREPAEFELRYEDGGRELWLSVTAMPLGDGFTLSLADITGLKRANLALDEARGELLAANRRLEAAMAQATATRQDLETEVECRKELEDELRRLAMTDSLTGLANRAAVMSQGERLAIRAAPLSAIVLDIDRFKRINDAYGHPAGDRVLVAVADLLHASLRADTDQHQTDLHQGIRDLAGRLGGEEFVVLLPRTGLAEATELAERLRAALARRPVDLAAVEAPMEGMEPPPRLCVTASFGVAALAPGGSVEGLLASCDEALYRAKREGRDRVVAHRPVPAASAA